MRTRAALSILVALWLIALATSTARADEGWTITSFHSAGAFQKATCFEGPTGSREPCAISGNPSALQYGSTRQLGSGEQLSIVTALHKGAVNVPPPLLESRKRQFPQDAFEITPLTV